MSKFKKTPLTNAEKEKKADAFINFVSEGAQHQEIKLKEPVLLKKEATKSVLLRMPESFKNDIYEIISYTGLSFNAVCLELLRPAIKRKLKELKED